MGLMRIPVELYALGCVLLVILCFGAAGGFVSGFLVRKKETQNAKPEVAGDGDEIDLSSRSRRKHLVNALAGAVGAFAFAPFGARILDLKLEPLFSLVDVEETVKSTLFLISLSAIGGFAGYRMLTSLANKMLAKLEERADDLDERTRSLETSKAQLEEKTSALQESNVVLEAKLLEAQADLHVSEARFQDALSLLDDFFKRVATVSIPSEVLASAHKTKGRALKRVGRVREALAAADEGLELPGVPPRARSSLLYNKACYTALLAAAPASAQDVQAVVALLKGSHALFPLKKSELDDDKDFDPIRETDAFKAFLSELS